MNTKDLTDKKFFQCQYYIEVEKQSRLSFEHFGSWRSNDVMSRAKVMCCMLNHIQVTIGHQFLNVSIPNTSITLGMSRGVSIQISRKPTESEPGCLAVLEKQDATIRATNTRHLSQCLLRILYRTKTTNIYIATHFREERSGVFRA